MRWRLGTGGAIVTAALVSGCETPAPEPAGFAGDPRPTFADDPYEDQIILDWQPWSDDLFGRSSSDTPILLHLGAHWCHLCHVYDRAVFGNEDFAAIIEDNFTLVRVDPDERPDIDRRFNQGNWPSVCVLSPDGDLVAGTPFAPDELESFLRASLATYVTGGDSLRSALKLRRDFIADSQPFEREQGALDPSVRDRLFAAIVDHVDADYGGFRPGGEGSSKVVAADILLPLLVELSANPGLSDRLLSFVERSADAMMRGAVRDHLNGGFFRSVDDRSWSLPRFGKTLRVQADVAELYMVAARVFDRPEFNDVARETIDFVFAELANPDSLTFSNCVDPDRGPHDDGSYYTWTVDQVEAILSPADAEAIQLVYGVAPVGEIPGRDEENTLYLAYDLDAAAERLGQGVNEFGARIDAALARMRTHRQGEGRPRIDSRAYAASNLAFARTLLGASTVFDDPSYRSRALRLIDFFTARNASPNGGVPHAFDGESIQELEWFDNQVSGAEALVRAFEVTGDQSYLDRARRLETHVADAYRNEVTGAYWDIPNYASGPGFLKLKLRPIRENIRYAKTLMDLAILAGDAGYAARARDVLAAFAQSYASSGLASIQYAIETHRLLSNQSTTDS